MEPIKAKLTDGTLETWLESQEDKVFPQYDPSKGEISYQERYKRIKEALRPYHQIVEKGALLQSAKAWQKEAKKIIRKGMKGRLKTVALDRVDNIEPLVYLNRHGLDHVDRVVQRASELFTESGCQFSGYEAYLLLCAIQFHDVGNVFGRAAHEQRCKDIMDEKCRDIIKDTVERNSIVKIAVVHGGCWGTDPDTISALAPERVLFNHRVRKRFLAAILRFADELADDSTRADKVALEQSILPEGSEIFHRYSEALHSVKIEKGEVQLGFDFTSSLALEQFSKNGKAKFLLDEIYSRTLKMERERRYCMRFMRPDFHIDQIRVEVVIQCENDPLLNDRITYTLKESGYPDHVPERIQQFDKNLKTGEAECRFIKKEWNL